MTELRGAPITGIEASAYRIPTDLPEADGTLTEIWDETDERTT
jgi:hypothetical protein